jgi:hypothetical protein
MDKDFRAMQNDRAGHCNWNGQTVDSCAESKQAGLSAMETGNLKCKKRGVRFQKHRVFLSRAGWRVSH